MAVEAHLSWNGHNISGDERSIGAVQTLMHEAGYTPELRKRLLEMQKEIDAAASLYTEKLAACMIDNSLATGHGDNFEALLGELKWQLEELRTELWAANQLGNER